MMPNVKMPCFLSKHYSFARFAPVFASHTRQTPQSSASNANTGFLNDFPSFKKRKREKGKGKSVVFGLAREIREKIIIYYYIIL